jgi:hypothetical protein
VKRTFKTHSEDFGKLKQAQTRIESEGRWCDWKVFQSEPVQNNFPKLNHHLLLYQLNLWTKSLWRSFSRTRTTCPAAQGLKKVRFFDFFDVKWKHRKRCQINLNAHKSNIGEAINTSMRTRYVSPSLFQVCRPIASYEGFPIFRRYQSFSPLTQRSPGSELLRRPRQSRPLPARPSYRTFPNCVWRPQYFPKTPHDLDIVRWEVFRIEMHPTNLYSLLIILFFSGFFGIIRAKNPGPSGAVSKSEYHKPLNLAFA